MTSNTPTDAEPDTATAAPGEEPTIGRLVTDVSRDLSTLIHDEIQLAKSELKISVKNGGTGAGLFAAALFLVLLGIVMLSAAFAFFLSMTGLHLAWCFLIVFGAYVLVAGLLVAVGVSKVKKVRGPERAIHQAKESKTLLQRG
jgi:hypothetical protein